MVFRFTIVLGVALLVAWCDATHQWVSHSICQGGMHGTLRTDYDPPRYCASTDINNDCIRWLRNGNTPGGILASGGNITYALGAHGCPAHT